MSGLTVELAVYIHAISTGIKNIHLWRTVFVEHRLSLACPIFARTADYSVCVASHIFHPLGLCQPQI